MIIYNKYVNQQDYTWYDSSNVIFSKCYDNAESNTKTLKIVFKNGRTYLYKDVDINDYLTFKTAQSNGQAVNASIIKKYKGVRITDTDIDKLSELKDSFINDEKSISETQVKDLDYKIDYVEKDGEFTLTLGDKVIYHGNENKVSLFSLFKSMNIAYSLNVVEVINYKTDENKDIINLEDE